MEHTVGVVIATRNRGALLARTLHHLAALAERPPIVVVDNGSTDEAARRVPRRFPDVRLIELDRDVGAAARTIGVQALPTPYVAFADDDSWWAPGALRRAAELFDADPRLGLVAARILVGPDRRLDPTSAEMAVSPIPAPSGRAAPAVLGFLACGAVVRRDAYLEVGGFHPRFGFGAEETLLALDLAANGYWLGYADDIVAYHRPAARTYDGRPRNALRNGLWTTWLRLGHADVIARTAGLIRHAVRDPHLLPAVVDALAGVRWVHRERKTLPPSVTDAFRLLEERNSQVNG